MKLRRFFFSMMLSVGLLFASQAFAEEIPASGPKPGEPGYDQTNYCENQWKYVCLSQCGAGDVYEPQISCGKKKEQGMGKCCHPKNFKPAGAPQPSQKPTPSVGASDVELQKLCSSPPNPGVCRSVSASVTGNPCLGNDEVMAGACSADGSTVCCIKDAAQAAQTAQSQTAFCAKNGGSCSVGSCPSGTTGVGMCDGGLDQYCCQPIDQNQQPTAADFSSSSTGVTPLPPDPFNDKGQAGFDSVKSYYEFQDPLNLQGTNKFSKLIQRIITWALPLVGSLFLAVIVYAGILWMTAGGEAKQVDKAKKLLVNSVIGMMIVFFSYAIVTNIITYFGQAAFGP